MPYLVCFSAHWCSPRLLTGHALMAWPGDEFWNIFVPRKNYDQNVVWHWCTFPSLRKIPKALPRRVSLRSRTRLTCPEVTALYLPIQGHEASRIASRKTENTDRYAMLLRMVAAGDALCRSLRSGIPSLFVVALDGIARSILVHGSDFAMLRELLSLYVHFTPFGLYFQVNEYLLKSVLVKMTRTPFVVTG